MAVARITLESENDSVVVSDSNDEFFESDIVLDTDPKGIYDTGFTMRTQSGAFEIGGRIVGESVPIREMTLPFWLSKASRARFQKLWGTPGNIRKVRWHYDGPSGRRSLTLKLAKEILYTTEDGFDADIDDCYHAVVTALAVNPMYEGEEDVAEWTNPPGAGFEVTVKADGGRFPLSVDGQAITIFSVSVVNALGGSFPLTFGGNTATVAYNAAPSAVQSALAALPSIGAGNVAVTGTPGNYVVVISNVTGTLTGSISGLLGLLISVNIDRGLPFDAAPSAVRSALEALPAVGAGNVTVTGTAATETTAGNYSVVFSTSIGEPVLTGSNGSLTADGFWGDIGLSHGKVTVRYAPKTGWFRVWNPTDQNLWLEWSFDPAQEWQFPDFAFGQERKWGRAVGEDAARMIVSPELTQMLSVMSDPFMDTYVNADLSNVAEGFNGVEPLYPVPPYTGTEDDPILVPVICRGPAGAKATLRQRRFWSAESGLDEP